MSFVPVSASLIKSENFFNHVDNALPYRSARAIRDPKIVKFLTGLQDTCKLVESLENKRLCTEFLNAFPKWLSRSRTNSLRNIEALKFLTYTHGTIQAFDGFYVKHRRRRFRCFKGEFMYHRATWRQAGYKFEYLEDSPIETGDALILSLPFSDSGSKHPLMDETISTCNCLNVPVLVDCAYINIGSSVEFDFAQPCIDVVAFSLSKAFHGLDKLRIGVRFKRSFEDDFIDVFNIAGMVNQYACAVALSCIQEFAPDFNFVEYRDRQIEVCKNLKLTPSDCVIFGLGQEEWSAYNRGGMHNRLCINSLLEAKNSLGEH